MKKIIIILIGLLLVSGLSYIIYNMIDTGNEKTNITIITFSKDLDNDYWDIIKNANKDFIEKTNKPLDFNLITHTGKKFSFRIEEPEIMSKKKEKIEILIDSLMYYLSRDTANSVLHPNIKIETVLNLIKSSKNDLYNHIYLVGAFTDCYSIKDAEESVQSISLDSFGMNLEYCQIINLLKTNNKEPEILVLNEFIRKGVKIVSIPQQSEIRVCKKNNLKDVHTIFFKKLNEENTTKFLAYLQKEYSKDIRLIVWNSGLLNNKVIELVPDSLDSIVKQLSALEDGSWTSIGFLINQANVALRQLPDSVEKDLVIIGSLPSESKGNQVDPSLWISMSKINNLDVFFGLPYNIKETLSDKGIINGVKKQHNIQINKFQF